MRPTDQQSQPPSRPAVKDVIMERNEAPGSASVPQTKQAQRNGDQQNRPPLQRSTSSNVAKKRPVSRELSIKIMENMRKRKMKTPVPSDDLCRTWHHQKGAHKCSECSHYSFSIKRLADHFMLVHRKILTTKRLKKCPKYDVHDPKRTSVRKMVDSGVSSLSTSKSNARTKGKLGVAVSSTSAASTNSSNTKRGSRLGVEASNGSSKSTCESTLKTENKSRVFQDNRVPRHAHQRVPDIATQVEDDDDDVIEIPIVHTCQSKRPATTINMQTQANHNHTSSRHQSPQINSSSNVDMKPRMTCQKAKDNLLSKSSALPPGFERHEIHESLQSVLGPEPSCSDTNDPEPDQSDTCGLDPEWSDSEAWWSNQEKQKDHEEKTTQRHKEHAVPDCRKTLYSSQVEENHASLKDEARLISEAKSNKVILLLRDQHYIHCNYCLERFKSRRDLKRHRYYECTVQRKCRLPSSNKEVSKQGKKQKFMEKYREVFKDKEGIRLHPQDQTTAACSPSGVRNESKNQENKFGKGKKLHPRDVSKASGNLCRKSFPNSKQDTTPNNQKHQGKTQSKKVTTKNFIRAGQSSSLPLTSTGISSKSLDSKQTKFSTESKHNEKQYGDASNTTIQPVSSKKPLPFKKSSKQSRGLSEKNGTTNNLQPQEVLSTETQRSNGKMFKPPEVKSGSACEQALQFASKGKIKSKDHQGQELSNACKSGSQQRPSTSRESNEKTGSNKSNADLQSLQSSTCTKEKKIPKGHKSDRQQVPLPNKALHENLCEDTKKGSFAKGSSLSSISSTTPSTSNKISISGRNKAASQKMAHSPSQSKTTGLSAFEDFLASRDRYTMKNALKRRRSTENEVTARKKSCIRISMSKNMSSTETNSNEKEGTSHPSHFQSANSSEGEYNLQETLLSPENISYEQANTDQKESPSTEAVLESYVPKQKSSKISAKRSKSNDNSFAMEKAPAKSQNTVVSSDTTVKPQTSVSTSDKEVNSRNHIKATLEKSSVLQNSLTLSDAAITESTALPEMKIPKSRIYSYLGSVVEQLNIPIADSQPSSVQNEDNQEVAEKDPKEVQTEIGSCLKNFMEEAETIEEERHSLPCIQKVVKEPEKIGDHSTVERTSAKSRAKHASDKHLDTPQKSESNFKADINLHTPPSSEYVDHLGRIIRITLARRPNSAEVKSSETCERQIDAYDGSENQDGSVVTDVGNESDGSHCLDERDSVISVEELEKESNVLAPKRIPFKKKCLAQATNQVEADVEKDLNQHVQDNNQKLETSGLLSGSETNLSMKEQVNDGQSLTIKQKQQTQQNLGNGNLESAKEVQNKSKVDKALIEDDQSSAAAPISTGQPVMKVSGFNVEKARTKFSSILKRVNKPIQGSCTKPQNSDAKGTNDLADSIEAQSTQNKVSSVQNEVPSAQNKVTQAEDVPPEELDVSHELVIDLDTNTDNDLPNSKQPSQSETTTNKISSGKQTKEDITESKQTKQINSQGVSGEKISTNSKAESNKTTTESSNFNTSTSESDNSFDNKNDEEIDNMAAAIEAAVSRPSESDTAEVEPQVDLETHTQLSREYLADTLGPYLHNLKAACAQPSSCQRPQSSLQNSSRQADFERMRKLVSERKQRENQQRTSVKGTNDREAETPNSNNRPVMASKYSGSSQDSNKMASEQVKTVYRCSVCCQEFDSLKARYSSQHACRYQDSQAKVINRSKSAIKHPANSKQHLSSNQSKPAHHRKEKCVRFDIPHGQRRHSLPSVQSSQSIRHREEYSRGNIGHHRARQGASHRSREERISSRNSRHNDSTYLSQVFPLNKKSQRNEKQKDGKSSRHKDAIGTSSSVECPVSTQEPVGLISLPSPVAPRMATVERSQNQNEKLCGTQEPIGLISLPSPAPGRQPSINRNQTEARPSLLPDGTREQCQLDAAQVNPSFNSKQQDKPDKVGNSDEKDVKSREEKRIQQPNTSTNVSQETNQSITLEMTCEDESDLSRGLSVSSCYLPPWINSNMSEIVASPRPPSRSEEAAEVASATKESSTETSTTEAHASDSSVTNVLADDLYEKETHSDVSEISAAEISTSIATLPSSSNPQMTSGHSSSAIQSSVSHSLGSQTVQKERNSSSTTDIEVQDDTSDSLALDPEVLLAQLNEINSISSGTSQDLDGKIVTLAKKIMINYKLMTTLQKKKKQQELDKLKASGIQSTETGQGNQSGQDVEKSSGSESRVSDIVEPSNNSVSVSRPNQNNDVQIIQSSSTARRRSFDDGGQKTVRARHNSAPNYTQVNRASVVPTTPRNRIPDVPVERTQSIPDANNVAVNDLQHDISSNCITGTTNSAVYNPSQALNSTLTVSSVISQQITATQSIFRGDTMQLQNQPESVMGSIQQSQHQCIQMQQNPSNVTMQENQNNFEWRQQVPNTGLENMILRQSQQQRAWLQQQEQLQQQLQRQQEAQRQQTIQQQLRELRYQQEQVQRQLQQCQWFQTPKQQTQQHQRKELQQTQQQLKLRQLLQQRSQRQLLHRIQCPQNQRQVVQFPQGQQQQQTAEQGNNWQSMVEPRFSEQSTQNQQSTGHGQNSPHFMQVRGQQQPRELLQQRELSQQMQPQLQQQQQRLDLEHRQQNHQIQQKQQQFQQRQRQQQHLHHRNEVQQHQLQQREHHLQQQHQQSRLFPGRTVHNQQHWEQSQPGNTQQMLQMLQQLGPNLEGNRRQLLEMQHIMEQNIGSLTPFYHHMLACIREKLRANQSNQEHVESGTTSCHVQNQQSQLGLPLQAHENTPNTPVYRIDQVQEDMVRHAVSRQQTHGPHQSESQMYLSSENLIDSNHQRDPSPLETSNAQVEQERENRSSVHSNQSDTPADHPSREPSPAQQGQGRTSLSGLVVCTRYFQQFDLKTQTPSVANEIARMKTRYRQLEIQSKNAQTPAEKFTADLLVTILVKDLRILGLNVKRTPLEKRLQILNPSSTEACHVRAKINAITNLLIQGQQQKLKAQNLLASAVANQVATTSVASAFNIKQEPREQSGPSSGRSILGEATNHAISPTTSTPDSPLLCNDSQSDNVAGNSNTLQIQTVPQNDYVSSESQYCIAEETSAQEGYESPSACTTPRLASLEDRNSENLTPIQHEKSTAVNNEYQEATNASNVLPLDVICSSSSSQPTQEIEHSGNSADVQVIETTATDSEHHVRTTSTDDHLTSNANKLDTANNGSSSQDIPNKIQHETPLQQNDTTTSGNHHFAVVSAEQLVSTESQSDSPSSSAQDTTQPCNMTSVQKAVSPDIIHVASETSGVEHIAAKESQHDVPSTTQSTSNIGHDSGPSITESTNDVSHSVIVSDDDHTSSASSCVPENPANDNQHGSSESYIHTYKEFLKTQFTRAPLRVQRYRKNKEKPGDEKRLFKINISHKGPIDAEAIVNHPKNSPSTQTFDPVGTPRQHSVLNDHISSSDVQADTPHTQESDHHQANSSPIECGHITIASNHAHVINIPASEEHDANGNREDSISCTSGVAQETPTNDQLLRDTSYIQCKESSATTAKKISNNPLFSTVENQGDTCGNVQVAEKEKTSGDTGSAVSFSNLVPEETPTLDQSSDVTSVQLEKPAACAIQQIQSNSSPSVHCKTSPAVTSQDQSGINILASEEGVNAVPQGTPTCGQQSNDVLAIQCEEPAQITSQPVSMNIPSSEIQSVGDDHQARCASKDPSLKSPTSAHQDVTPTESNISLQEDSCIEICSEGNIDAGPSDLSICTTGKVPSNTASEAKSAADQGEVFGGNISNAPDQEKAEQQQEKMLVPFKGSSVQSDCSSCNDSSVQLQDSQSNEESNVSEVNISTDDIEQGVYDMDSQSNAALEEILSELQQIRNTDTVPAVNTEFPADELVSCVKDGITTTASPGTKLSAGSAVDLCASYTSEQQIQQSDVVTQDNIEPLTITNENESSAQVSITKNRSESPNLGSSSDSNSSEKQQREEASILGTYGRGLPLSDTDVTSLQVRVKQVGKVSSESTSDPCHYNASDPHGISASNHEIDIPKCNSSSNLPTDTDGSDPLLTSQGMASVVEKEQKACASDPTSCKNHEPHPDLSSAGSGDSVIHNSDSSPVELPDINLTTQEQYSAETEQTKYAEMQQSISVITTHMEGDDSNRKTTSDVQLTIAALTSPITTASKVTQLKYNDQTKQSQTPSDSPVEMPVSDTEKSVLEPEGTRPLEITKSTERNQSEIETDTEVSNINQQTQSVASGHSIVEQQESPEKRSFEVKKPPELQQLVAEACSSLISPQTQSIASGGSIAEQQESTAEKSQEVEKLPESQQHVAEACSSLISPQTQSIASGDSIAEQQKSPGETSPEVQKPPESQQHVAEACSSLISPQTQSIASGDSIAEQQESPGETSPEVQKPPESQQHVAEACSSLISPQMQSVASGDSISEQQDLPGEKSLEAKKPPESQQHEAEACSSLISTQTQMNTPREADTEQQEVSAGNSLEIEEQTLQSQCVSETVSMQSEVNAPEGTSAEQHKSTPEQHESPAEEQAKNEELTIAHHHVTDTGSAQTQVNTPDGTAAEQQQQSTPEQHESSAEEQARNEELTMAHHHVTKKTTSTQEKCNLSPNIMDPSLFTIPAGFRPLQSLPSSPQVKGTENTEKDADLINAQDQDSGTLKGQVAAQQQEIILMEPAFPVPVQASAQQPDIIITEPSPVLAEAQQTDIITEPSPVLAEAQEKRSLSPSIIDPSLFTIPAGFQPLQSLPSSPQVKGTENTEQDADLINAQDQDSGTLKGQVAAQQQEIILMEPAFPVPVQASAQQPDIIITEPSPVLAEAQQTDIITEPSPVLAEAQEKRSLSPSIIDPSLFTIPAGFQPLQSLPSSPQVKGTENTEQDADLINAQDQDSGTLKGQVAVQQQEIILTEPVSPVPVQAPVQQPDIIITEPLPVLAEAQQTDIIITEPVSPAPVSAASELILSNVAIQPALPDMSTLSSLVAPATSCSLSPVEVRPYRMQKRKADDGEADGPAKKKQTLEGNTSVQIQSCEEPVEGADKKATVNLTTVFENSVDNGLKSSTTSCIEVVDLTDDCDSDASSDLEIISLSPAPIPGQPKPASSSDKSTSDISALPAARPKEANLGSRSGTANTYLPLTVKLQEVAPASRTEQSASKSNQVNPKTNSKGQTTTIERASSNRLDQMAKKQSTSIPLLQSQPSTCASQSLPKTCTSQTNALISQPYPDLLQPTRVVQPIRSASNVTVVWNPNTWAIREIGSAKALKHPQQNSSNKKWPQQIPPPIPNSNVNESAPSNRKSTCNPTVLNSSMSSSQTQKSNGHPISLSVREPQQVPTPQSAPTTTANQRSLPAEPRQRVTELQSSHNTASRQESSHSRSSQPSTIWVPNSLSSPACSTQTSAANTSHHSTNANRAPSATETRPVAEVTPQIQANTVQPKPQDALLPVIVSVQSLNPDVWKSSNDNQQT